jgi:hypothetical protein
LLVLSEVEQAHRVRVLETLRQLGLALEAAHALVLCDQIRQDDLERDAPAEVQLHGREDRAEAALADLPLDAITTGDDVAGR